MGGFVIKKIINGVIWNMKVVHHNMTIVGLMGQILGNERWEGG